MCFMHIKVLTILCMKHLSTWTARNYFNIFILKNKTFKAICPPTADRKEVHKLHNKIPS